MPGPRRGDEDTSIDRQARPWPATLGKLLAMVVLAAGLVLLLALPIREAPAPAPPPEQTTLELWMPADREHTADLLAMISQFEADHDVRIIWRNRTVNEADLTRAAAAGYGPDVVALESGAAHTLVHAGVLMPLDDGLNGSPPISGRASLYLAGVGQDDLWTRSLRLAIPRSTRDPELARAFVAHVLLTLDTIPH